MKKNILILCFVFILFPFVFVNQAAANQMETTEEGNLELKGLLADENLIRSLTKEVFILKALDGIDITFTIKCSVRINVINLDNGSVVYEKYIQNTQQENQMQINTGGWTEANYKIVFENVANNKTAYACFKIE